MARRRLRVVPPPGQQAIWFAPERAAFRFIDLFAGIGGIRLGLQEAGGVCVYSVEIDKYARRTYIRNFGSCEADDIRDVPAAALPEYDLLAAGFPCQPFSLAGVSKKNSLGRAHGFEDEKSGNLFFEIERLLRDGPKPRVVFLENVRNLRSHDRGRTFSEIQRRLDALGYELADEIVDARHWVPQHRERIFIVGFLRTVYRGQRFQFPEFTAAAPPTLKDVLEEEVDGRYMLSEHLWRYLQDYRAKHEAKGNGFGYSVFGPDDVARTLSARYHKDGSRSPSGPMARHREGSPPTSAPASWASNTFDISVSDTQAYRQFGNAVVVPVVRFLAEEIVRQARLGEVLAAAS